MSRKTLTLAATVLVAILVGLLVWNGHPHGASPTEATGQLKKARTTQRRQVNPADAVRSAMRGATYEKRKPEKGTSAKPKGVFAHLDAEDRRLCENLQTALDGGEFSEVVAAAEKALGSKSPEVRENAVDALGWFGAEALPELTASMSDPDEDVAQAAMHHWDIALSEIEETQSRLEVAMAAFTTLKDVNALESIGGQFSIAATEYIDEVDDKNEASGRRVEIVQALVDMMGPGKSKISALAAEAYEDITGCKWRGIDEAEKYLRNPDDYEEPEDE